jgi:hypothetical protein
MSGANSEEVTTWSQWGQNAQHTGSVAVPGGPLLRVVADLIPDPFADDERADPNSPGRLHVHYQVPLIEDGHFYMERKGGSFTGVSQWQTQVWSEVKMAWRDGRAVELWAFSSDWKPVPFDGRGIGPGREPVFQPSGNWRNPTALLRRISNLLGRTWTQIPTFPAR